MLYILQLAGMAGQKGGNGILLLKGYLCKLRHILVKQVSVMEKPVLADPDRFPDAEVIGSHIGPVQKLWDALFSRIREQYPDVTGEWRYYHDGKSWLLKMTAKKKTIFWLSVVPGTFRITFYFGDKAEQAVLASGISDELKNSFLNGKRFGKIRGITLSVQNEEDVGQVMELTGIRYGMK
jgi:hypothetical protein